MAMKQYRDGKFGPFVPIKEFMEQQAEALRMLTERQSIPFKYLSGDLKAIHFGTEKELEEVKAKADLQQQVETLQEKVKALELKERLEKSTIILSTVEDIRKYAKEAVTKTLSFQNQ